MSINTPHLRNDFPYMYYQGNVLLLSSESGIKVITCSNLFRAFELPLLLFSENGCAWHEWRQPWWLILY